MKHLAYLRYLIRHKWFVFLAGWRTDAPIWRLIIHDWSKFLPSEWFPYVEEFYGAWRTRAEKYPSDDAIHVRFDRAWLHHQHFNPHHWQYWILREDDGDTKYLPMPEHFVREMVADWSGAGRAITGRWDVWAWYRAKRHYMDFHPSTAVLIEALVEEEYKYMTAKHDESLSDA